MFRLVPQFVGVLVSITTETETIEEGAILTGALFLPIDKAMASRAVVVLVTGWDVGGGTETS